MWKAHTEKSGAQKVCIPKVVLGCLQTWEVEGLLLNSSFGKVLCRCTVRRTIYLYECKVWLLQGASGWLPIHSRMDMGLRAGYKRVKVKTFREVKYVCACVTYKYLTWLIGSNRKDTISILVFGMCDTLGGNSNPWIFLLMHERAWEKDLFIFCESSDCTKMGEDCW